MGTATNGRPRRSNNLQEILQRHTISTAQSLQTHRWNLSNWCERPVFLLLAKNEEYKFSEIKFNVFLFKALQANRKFSRVRCRLPNSSRQFRLIGGFAYVTFQTVRSKVPRFASDDRLNPFWSKPEEFSFAEGVDRPEVNRAGHLRVIIRMKNEKSWTILVDFKVYPQLIFDTNSTCRRHTKFSMYSSNSSSTSEPFHRQFPTRWFH